MYHVKHLRNDSVRFTRCYINGLLLLLFLISGSVEYPMPYDSCLASCSVGWRHSVAGLILRNSACPLILSLIELYLSDPWGFCSLFYLECFPLHPGIACLGYVHCGIVCLASHASDWAGALWYGLTGL